MILNRREFFKRKNRPKIYNVYAQAVDRAYDLSERYQSKVIILRNRKREFSTGSHIWTLLDKTEKEFTSSFEHEAYLRCNSLKRNAFTVNIAEYDNIILDTQKLANAIGYISAVIDFVDYLDQKKLKVRAK